MQRLEVSGAVRLIYGSLGVKELSKLQNARCKDKDFIGLFCARKQQYGIC